MKYKGLQLFNFEGKRVRVAIQDNGEFAWVAKDVCDALGIVKYRDVIKNLDADERVSISVDTPGGRQEMSAVTESGMYMLIMHGRTQEAVRFRRWVTHEVIPAISKHGAYVTPKTAEEWIANPDMMIQVLESLKEERALNKELSVTLKEKTVQLDEAMEWFTIKRVAFINDMDWQDLDWRLLKGTSNILEYEIKKVFDANYGAVNAYHIDVWKREYPNLYYGV